MRESLVFGSGIKCLMRAAKKKRDRNRQRQQSNQQSHPGHFQTKSPDHQWDEPKHIKEQDISQQMEAHDLLLKCFPTLFNGFRVERLTQGFFNGRFPLRYAELLERPYVFSQITRQTRRRRLKKLFAIQ